MKVDPCLGLDDSDFGIRVRLWILEQLEVSDLDVLDNAVELPDEVRRFSVWIAKIQTLYRDCGWMIESDVVRTLVIDVDDGGVSSPYELRPIFRDISELEHHQIADVEPSD